MLWNYNVIKLMIGWARHPKYRLFLAPVCTLQNKCLPWNIVCYLYLVLVCLVGSQKSTLLMSPAHLLVASLNLPLPEPYICYTICEYYHSRFVLVGLTGRTASCF